MDCPKRSAGASASASAVGDLPDGPLVEILSRVPAKSVCRFKCVSKAWRELIDDPHNRKRLPQAMQGLFCMTVEIPEGVVDTFNFEDVFSFIDLAARSVPLDIDPFFSFLTELPWIKNLFLQDSCNGLVLFENSRQRYSGILGYIVCNPTTKQWVAVPVPVPVPTCGSRYPKMFTYTFLAFDPAVSSHFHLVQLQVDDSCDLEFISLHAYSSETGTWSHSQTDDQKEQEQLEGWHHQARFNVLNLPPCSYVNGFLHLIFWDLDQLKIVALDVQGKARRMISVPDKRYSKFSYLGQSQGCLHYITEEKLDTNEGEYKLNIWVLQDYDTQEWVLKYTVNTHEVFGEHRCPGMPEFEVVDIHQDCNVIFFNHHLEHTLVAYDMDRKKRSVIANFVNQKELKGTGRYVPYFSESPVLTNKQ